MSARISFTMLGAGLFFLVTVTASCQNTAEKNSATTTERTTYEVLSKPAFKQRLAEAGDYLLVDVRRPEEYEAAHIQGAININFLDPPVFEEAFSKLDTNQTLMIYCRSGNRSRKSAEKLQAMGFRKIYDLEGGFLNWQQKE